MVAPRSGTVAHTMRATAPLAVICTTMAVAGGGCAGSYEGTSKDDYVRKANAVCAVVGAGVTPTVDALLAKPLPSIAEQRAVVGDVVVPGFQDRVDKLRVLEPPLADQKTIDEFIRVYQKAINQVQADPTQLTSGDPFLQAFIAARTYGLTSCTH